MVISNLERNILNTKATYLGAVCSIEDGIFQELYKLVASLDAIIAGWIRRAECLTELGVCPVWDLVVWCFHAVNKPFNSVTVVVKDEAVRAHM